MNYCYCPLRSTVTSVIKFSRIIAHVDLSSIQTLTPNMQAGRAGFHVTVNCWDMTMTEDSRHSPSIWQSESQTQLQSPFLDFLFYPSADPMHAASNWDLHDQCSYCKDVRIATIFTYAILDKVWSTLFCEQKSWAAIGTDLKYGT